MIKRNTFIVTVIFLGLIILTNFFQINFNRGVITKLIDKNDSLTLKVNKLANQKGFDIHRNMLETQEKKDGLIEAINNEQWELAGYDLERLKTLFNDFEKSDYSTNGKNISSLTTELVNTPLNNLNIAIEQKDKQQALEGSNSLIRSCNACHSLSGKDFLNKKQ